jgi:hypothetical protein
MHRDELLQAFRAFETEGLDYVLIGATAMGIHGLVRATEDVDLVIRATPENIERLQRALHSVYPDDPHIDEIRPNDLLGDYPVVRYYPPSGDLFFDVMTRLGESASFDTVESEVKEVEGIRVRVATPAALYRLKKGTLQPLGSTGRGSAARAVQTEREGLTLTVQKFRSADEMNAAPVLVPVGNAFDRFVRHCARYWAISPRIYPRGVFRFRTIEEAQAARDRAANHGPRPTSSSPG